MTQEAIQQTKAVAVAGGTLVSGMGTVFQWLPPILGCIATLFGIVLSTFLMYKAYNDIKYTSAGRRLRDGQFKELEDRKERGLPSRRHSDKAMLNGEAKKHRHKK